MRCRLIAAAAVVLVAAIAAPDEGLSSLEHPGVKDVLAMAEAGASEKVMAARVEQMEGFPPLDGHELAELKRRGVPDAVLLMMIERTAPQKPTNEGSSSKAEPDGQPVPSGTGLLRVSVDRPFPVTFCEVVVNGELVHQEGKLWFGAVGAGGSLPRPRTVRGSGRFMAYASPMPPGRHTISVGFAVSTVEEDRGASWAEHAGEQYLTRGIRSTGESLAGQAPLGNPGAECDLVEGNVCDVVATFERSSPSTLGGLPVYSIRYDVEVTTHR
jgi:hypothetical protein